MPDSVDAGQELLETADGCDVAPQRGAPIVQREEPCEQRSGGGVDPMAGGDGSLSVRGALQTDAPRLREATSHTDVAESQRVAGVAAGWSRDGDQSKSVRQLLARIAELDGGTSLPLPVSARESVAAASTGASVPAATVVTTPAVSEGGARASQIDAASSAVLTSAVRSASAASSLTAGVSALVSADSHASSATGRLSSPSVGVGPPTRVQPDVRPPRAVALPPPDKPRRVLAVPKLGAAKKSHGAGKFHGRTLLFGFGVPIREIPHRPLFLLRPIRASGRPETIPVDPRPAHYAQLCSRVAASLFRCELQLELGSGDRLATPGTAGGALRRCAFDTREEEEEAALAGQRLPLPDGKQAAGATEQRDEGKGSGMSRRRRSAMLARNQLIRSIVDEASVRCRDRARAVGAEGRGERWGAATRDDGAEGRGERCGAAKRDDGATTHQPHTVNTKLRDRIGDDDMMDLC